MWYLGVWFRVDYGGARLKAGLGGLELGDLEGLFKP